MKKFLFIILLCAGFTYASAQEVYTSSGKAGFHKKTKREKGYDPSKLVVGGGLVANYSSGYAAAGISPIVGYNFFHNFTAGVGLGYLYAQQPYLQTTDKLYYIKEHIIYPSLWARYIVFRGLYLTTSFEHDIIKLTVPDYDHNNPSQIIDYKSTVNTQCLLAGVGLKQPLGGRVSFYFEVMHEFLQNNNPNSPYYGQGPLIFRAGVAAGL